jgi:acyl-CoA synthetase (AMP-forming)/AMP-acid ligase II
VSPDPYASAQVLVRVRTSIAAPRAARLPSMQLTQGLHRSLQTTSDRTATVFGTRERSFREQADRIARLAAGLRALGVGAGDRVGMLALNSDRYAEYLLAVPWAGGVVNPVNIRWSVAEIAYALNDSGTSCLLIDDAFVPVGEELRQKCPDLRWLIYCGEQSVPTGMVGYEDLVAAQPMPDARRCGDDLAGLFYTGGTTGFPKGVMLSHRNIVTSALGTLATRQVVQEGSVLLHAAPMFHVAGLCGWIAQVLIGGVHVMVPAFKPDAVFAAIRDHQVTDVVLVPTMIQMLIDDPAMGEYDMSSLRNILYGGSPISEALLTRAMRLLPGVRFTQVYGMTEAAPVASLLWHQDHHGSLLNSAGRAAPHSEIRVIDESGGAAPTGAVGEICVRGDHVTRGYWNRPDETAAVLVDGWYRTGDAGYLDANGFLYVVDRVKDMIISGGENVYGAEVENALCSHPSVAACAVIGLPSDQWGETVHAVVVPAANAEIDPAALQKHVRVRLAGYKVPRSIEVVEQLPLSGIGKVLKRQLRDDILSRPAGAGAR